jgi:hypothetical protein
VIPGEFTGVWRRISLAIGDAPPDEPCDVVWVQARGAYADLRIPRRAGVAPMAFAGETTWDAPRLTWAHHLDLDRSGADVGVVEWRDDDLVERGLVDDSGVPYEEVWRRVSAVAPRPILALARHDRSGQADGAVVQVGDHAIVMLRTPASTGSTLAVRHDVSTNGDWSCVGRLGHAPLPALPVAEPDWRPGDGVELPGFGEWRVRELEP